MKPLRTALSISPKQRGAALMVMLVIMILGVAAILVTSLSTSTLSNMRQDNTATALAQAKEALIGRAVSDDNHPGSLPCPDTSPPGSANSGIAAALVGNNCPSNIGRLPWKTLRISELRDSNGEILWYAISPSLRDDDSAQPINSDTQGVFSISGNITVNNVAAIVFAPNAPLCGQSRSSNNVGDYLEAVSSVAATSAVVSTASSDCSGTPFNDNLLAITTDQIFHAVEKRIAREVKICLDDYAADAANTNHRYPWAAPVTDTNVYPNRPGTYNVFFGRMSETSPNISTTTGGTPPSNPVLTYLNNVQTALTAYLNNPNSTTLSNLRSVGDTLKDNTTSGTPAHTAGTTADNCTGMSCTATLQSQIDTAMGNGSPDPTMPSSWSAIASCSQLINAPYWPDWRDLVFYQIAVGYQPGGGTFVPLHISGSGNPVPDNDTYQATVVIAGKMLTGQNPRSQSTPPTTYLETSGASSNAHDSAVGATPSTNFITYKSTDTANYSTVNDLVLCLDGRTFCK